MNTTTFRLKNSVAWAGSEVYCQQCDWSGDLKDCSTELVGEPLCPCCSAEVQILPEVLEFEPMPKREKDRLVDWFELGLLVTIAALLFAVLASAGG
jgi:NAD-dependent SIR2 family protein deacetylase